MIHIYLSIVILFVCSSSAFASEHIEPENKIAIYAAKKIPVHGKLIEFNKFVPLIIYDSYKRDPDEYTLGPLADGQYRLDNGELLQDASEQVVRTKKRKRGASEEAIVITRREAFTFESWALRISQLFPDTSSLVIRGLNYTPELPTKLTSKAIEKFGHLPNTITDLEIEFTELERFVLPVSKAVNWFERSLRILAVVCPKRLQHLTITYSCNPPGPIASSQSLFVDRWKFALPETITRVDINTNYFNRELMIALTSRLDLTGISSIYINGIECDPNSSIEFDRFFAEQPKESPSLTRLTLEALSTTLLSGSIFSTNDRILQTSETPPASPPTQKADIDISNQEIIHTSSSLSSVSSASSVSSTSSPPKTSSKSADQVELTRTPEPPAPAVRRTAGSVAPTDTHQNPPSKKACCTIL